MDVVTTSRFGLWMPSCFVDAHLWSFVFDGEASQCYK